MTPGSPPSRNAGRAEGVAHVEGEGLEEAPAGGCLGEQVRRER